MQRVHLNPAREILVLELQLQEPLNLLTDPALRDLGYSLDAAESMI
jgi:hypothetical protein